MSESNVAYVLADMTSPDVLHALEYQINKLKDKKPSAWFCDIVADGRHWATAVELKKKIQRELEVLTPWERFGGDAIVIELNLVPVKGDLRARTILKGKIRGAQTRGTAKNVNLRDENGKKLPTEY